MTVAVPADIPVSTPVVAFIVATELGVHDHVPEAVPDALSEIELPGHTEEGPDITPVASFTFM